MMSSLEHTGNTSKCMKSIWSAVFLSGQKVWDKFWPHINLRLMKESSMFANHQKLEQDQNKLFSAQFTTRTVHIGRCTLLKSGSKKNLKILKSAILARILTGNFIETVHVMRYDGLVSRSSSLCFDEGIECTQREMRPLPSRDVESSWHSGIVLIRPTAFQFVRRIACPFHPTGRGKGLSNGGANGNLQLQGK